MLYNVIINLKHQNKKGEHMKTVTASKSRIGGNIFLIDETLTDESHVHGVELQNSKAKILATWFCQSEEEALGLYSLMAASYSEVTG
jgi:hypothetical protein